MIGIYKITNKINGKVYIGLSTKIEKRWNRHRSAMMNPKDRNYKYPLYCAMRKYGIENFTFEVLEECKTSELSDKEIYYIALYDSHNRNKGYNQDSGGWYARHGKLTEEMVEAIKERIRTSTDLFTEIAKEFGLHENTIQNINSGRTWRMDDEQYPIRALPVREYKICDVTKSETKKRTKVKKTTKVETRRSQTPPVFTCKNCGAIVNRGSKYCVKCVPLMQRRAERPTPLKLAEMVKNLGFEATGRSFAVSGNTIKDWCKDYKIPYKLKELIAWYNDQMGIVPDPPKVKRKMSEIVRPVQQIDMNTGEVLNTFESATAATRYLGRGRYDHLLLVCNGKQKSSCGYFWKFA